MREWLRELREDEGITMSDLAKSLGISESYYCAIEHGVRQKKMDVALVSRISKALQVPICQIILWEESSL